MRAKDRAPALLSGRDVTFHRVGRSYNRTVATVVLYRHDLGAELVRIGVAAWWAARSAEAGLVSPRILISDLISNGRSL